MKKIILLISLVTILNACAQSTSFVGPSYTLSKSGSVVQAGNSIAASYGLKKTLNEPFISSLTNTDPRECQTIHTTNLNKIFFNTLDEIDCFRNPFSILR